MTIGSKGGALALGALVVAGCGDRAAVWDTPGAPVEARGLLGAVAIIDAPAERALMLPVEGDLRIAPVSLPIGRGFSTAKSTPDGRRLLVLARGDVPRKRASDQAPSLTLIDGSTSPSVLGRYELSDPFSGLALDPEEQFSVVYPTEADAAFVENPNELMIVDLSKPPGASNPKPFTLRSFGGRPKELRLTPKLSLPGGITRLLVVETDRDVALLDLGHLDHPEITVKLTSGAEPVTPAGVAVHDGEPDRTDDARIAIRLADRPDVVVLDLLPLSPDEQAASPQTFRPLPNVVDVGGVPGDVAFVRTDGGLRLAAPIPARSVLSLVDPVTGIGTDVPLGAPFERISVVTDSVGPTDKGSDVALLWSASSPNVAFVTLGVTVGKPYKSVDRLELEQPVADVLDVPAPNGHLKLLTAPGGDSFVVLNLPARTASPILAAAGTHAKVAADGLRAWMVAGGFDTLAELDLGTLHPKNLTLDRPVDDVFDVARRDGGRALVAVHPTGAVGLTILDAEHPSLDQTREYAAVLLGGLP